jgi:RsiW-degrading membrane proteinase PrsW (M82 family)
MGRKRDPVEARDDGSMDLYEISSWEVRSSMDRFAVWLYHSILASLRFGIIAFAVLILVAQFAIGGFGLVTNRIVGTFVLLSVVPALILAGYLWYVDVTTSEPLDLLVGTFFLGILFASFAGILNPILGRYVETIGSGFGMVPILGTLGLYFLVVGPIEEGVKLLAVRLHAYRKPSFDAVIDGAVYGAAAGLGFATIENALYITQTIESLSSMTNLIGAGTGIATVRALAGPGHVIYSAFAGYYLGLAKFNPDNAGPIVVKGLVIATIIHATYNTLVTVVVPAVATVAAIPQFLAFLGFIVVYDGLFILLLLRKLSHYNSAYRNLHDEGTDIHSEPTEFE